MAARTYTTHDIAEFCDVYPSSVVHWINSGKLKSYSTPGGHHRVTREDLIAFFAAFKMPLPKELAARPMRVMIVDDEAEIVRVVERAFARHGGDFETETCGSGVEALIRIGQAPPDLVILDLQMPNMGGAEAAQALRKLPSFEKTPIVALTAVTKGALSPDLSVAGFTAYLVKPIGPARLRQYISDLL